MSYKLPLFAAAAFLGGYMLISNRQLRVNEYELKVSKLPENFVGKKILLLADLHKKRYGDNFNNLVNSCIAAGLYDYGYAHAKWAMDDLKKYLCK